MNYDYEIEKMYHPENFVVLNEAQYRNTAIRRHFKSGGFRVVKDEKMNPVCINGHPYNLDECSICGEN